MCFIDIILPSETLLNSFYLASEHALGLFSPISFIQELFLNISHLLLEQGMKTTDTFLFLKELSANESIHIFITSLKLLLVMILFF